MFGVQLAATFARRTSFFRVSAKSMSSSVSTVPLLLSPDQIAPLGETVSILDASWFMPHIPRNPKDEFLSKRIPNAQFLDLDQVASSHELGLKHMMPGGRVFADACGMCLLLKSANLFQSLTRHDRKIRHPA